MGIRQKTEDLNDIVIMLMVTLQMPRVGPSKSETHELREKSIEVVAKIKNLYEKKKRIHRFYFEPKKI